MIRVLSTPRVTMRYFAEYLSRRLRMPVIDRTGLQGEFAFEIEWSADPGETLRTPATVPPAGPPSDLFGTAGRTAIREHLGLVLTTTQSPVDVLIVDRYSNRQQISLRYRFDDGARRFSSSIQFSTSVIGDGGGGGISTARWNRNRWPSGVTS